MFVSTVSAEWTLWVHVVWWTYTSDTLYHVSSQCYWCSGDSDWRPPTQVMDTINGHFRTTSVWHTVFFKTWHQLILTLYILVFAVYRIYVILPVQSVS